jgi:predicted HicB family RNase H-like nuclease
MSQYFDASCPTAHETASDGPGEDSDLKWLQVVRGKRAGVARMAGIDSEHEQELKETLRREEERMKEKQRQELQKQKWEKEKQVRRRVRKRINDSCVHAREREREREIEKVSKW